MAEKLSIFVAALLLVSGQAQPAELEDRADKNIEIMVQAARRLQLSPETDGHAYMLVKQETVRAPVAVIFGYVDNAAACAEIAEVLSDAPRAGTFKCHPIF
jgi:hypothetical protein